MGPFIHKIFLADASAQKPTHRMIRFTYTGSQLTADESGMQNFSVQPAAHLQTILLFSSILTFLHVHVKNKANVKKSIPVIQFFLFY